MSNSNSARIVLESDSRKRGAALHDGVIPAKKPWFDKYVFILNIHISSCFLFFCFFDLVHILRRMPFAPQTKLQQTQPPRLSQKSALLCNKHQTGHSSDSSWTQQHQQTKRALQQVWHHRQSPGTITQISIWLKVNGCDMLMVKAYRHISSVSGGI